jgi:hypothetical protein
MTMTTADLAEPATASEHGPGAVLAFEGMVVIQWAAARPSARFGVQPLHWPLTSVYDALTGKLITTVTRIQVHATADSFVTADLTMHTGEDGRPVYDIGQVRVADGKPATGTFPFWVTEMRVGEPGATTAPEVLS